MKGHFSFLACVINLILLCDFAVLQSSKLRAV